MEHALQSPSGGIRKAVDLGVVITEQGLGYIYKIGSPGHVDDI